MDTFFFVKKFMTLQGAEYEMLTSYYVLVLVGGIVWLYVYYIVLSLIKLPSLINIRFPWFTTVFTWSLFCGQLFDSLLALGSDQVLRQSVWGVGSKQKC